jgi:hypothetical protein
MASLDGAAEADSAVGYAVMPNRSHERHLLYEKLRARNALTGNSSLDWATSDSPHDRRHRHARSSARAVGGGDAERERALIRRRVRDAIFAPGRDVLGAFRSFDAGGSGYLPIPAMCTALCHLGVDVSTAEAASVFTPDMRSPAGGVKYGEFVRRLDDEAAIE